VVLHRCYDYVVARFEDASPKALGDEIDSVCGPAGEDHFARGPGVDEPGDFLADLVVGVGGPLAQVVDAAVDVGILLGVEPADRVDDRLGLLAGRGVVEIDQRLAADLLTQNREVLADTFDVQRVGG
jgi:hypothetical protein